ncbi:MAG: ATP-binding protein [Candidatus Thiodiazotropha sp.]
MSGISRLSIRQRLLLAASLVLGAFLGLTGLSLDKAFRSATEEALKARLLSNVYALLAAAEEGNEGQLTMPRVLTDPRFNRPDSGLYAQVIQYPEGDNWHSGSSLGQGLSFSRDIQAGESEIGRYQLSVGEVMGINFAVVWENFNGDELKYVLSVAEDLQPIQEQISTYRDTLLLWLGGAALLLLMVQGWVLSWGLRPLREVEDALIEIESGRSEKLLGRYPKELNRLTSNINSLIQHAQARQQRYRDSLGDLAHRLISTLSILQGIADQPDRYSQKTVREQVDRMNQIVSHQLQRAAASGRHLLTQSLEVEPLLERLVKSLDKVYLDKRIEWQTSVTPGSHFYGEEGDLMELLGNLMENACKYGQSQVRVTVTSSEQSLTIRIEDDGEGIPPHHQQTVFQRGHRADTRQPGQGIGMAVALDIAQAYGGRIDLGRSSDLGGASVDVDFPVN